MARTAQILNRTLAVWGATCLLALLVGLGVPASARAEALRAAVFDFEFLDSSQEGEMFGARADEARRLASASEQLRRLLAEGGIAVVDLAPQKTRIEKQAPLTKCNGCEADLARDLGAEVAVTGLVQKVSNLILNLNVYVRDARSGAMLRVSSTDIRGNTDEAWQRGVRYLVRNRLLDPPLELKPQ